LDSDRIDTIIFDLDDTLVVEKNSARAAMLAACELARERVNIDIETFHASIRES
jgi:phosphoglycolate phosphatase-like HAD superfamily hydrolase